MTLQPITQLTITPSLTIPLQRISDLLCSAFEGGSNYWYMIESQNEPTRFDFLSDAEFAKSMNREPTMYPHIDYPLNPGGSLTITANGDGERTSWVLNLEAIEKGLVVFMEKCPRHWADFMAENDDAITADCFLQCCLFGEVVYG